MAKTYDARLYLYQALIDLPAQVLMHDMYKRTGTRDVKTYGIMTLVGLGSSLMSLKGGQVIYDTLHKNEQPDANTEYFVSPITEHTYNVNFERYKHNVQPGGQDPLKKYLDNATSYSKGYMDLATTSIFGRAAYGTLSADTSNLAYALLYGLTQPLCVILEDSGKIK